MISKNYTIILFSIIFGLFIMSNIVWSAPSNITYNIITPTSDVSSYKWARNDTITGSATSSSTVSLGAVGEVCWTAPEGQHIIPNYTMSSNQYVLVNGTRTFSLTVTGTATTGAVCYPNWYTYKLNSSGSSLLIDLFSDTALDVCNDGDTTRTVTRNISYSSNTNLTSQNDRVYLKFCLNVTVKATGGTASYKMNTSNSYFFVPNETFASDITPPNLNVQIPLNNSYFNTTTINLNYTVSDDVGVDQCLFTNTTGTNVTLPSCQNTTFTALANQLNNITVYVNDTLNNFNKSRIFFTVDTTAPTVTLNLPSNSTGALPVNVTFNFTVTDNLSSTSSCSIYIDNVLNQTNSSTSNNTLTNFALNGISEGLHRWNVTCTDAANNQGNSETRTFTVNVTPILASISDSPDPIKGGNTITITASGIDDPNNGTLNFYCSEASNQPTSGNTICTGGTTTDTTPPYSLTCTYAVATDDTTHTVNCRVFDGVYYSTARSTNFTTDSTPPTTSVVSVAGDTAATYYDNVDDTWTNITVSGESSMACRYSTSDLAYGSMTNDCTVSGTQATCATTTTTQGLDAYNFYVACQDSLGNAQNSTQNLDIISLVHDWTAPTTSDNSSTTIRVPPYIVVITESDNLAYGSASIVTRFCTDTAGSCTPSTAIDDGGNVTFTASNRGVNFLRYNSSDPAGNIQSIQNKTININRFPVFTSASDDATLIRGGGTLRITTDSSDADSGQTLKLFVCNSTSATSAGCSHTTYCSNTTAASNASCSFTVETDDTAHTWYAFLYDNLNESATSNTSGTYTTDSVVPTVTIINPTNTTYSENSVTAQLSISETTSWAGYSLDGAGNVTMTNSTLTFWSATISSLSNGAHTLRFYANDSAGNMGTNTRVFSVDTTLPDTTGPTITVFSPTNTTFTSTSLTLNITLSEDGSSAVYSLDGNTNASLGNTSMRNWNATVTMSQASHNIKFYANDTSTNKNTGNSSLIYFTVDAVAPQNSTQGYTPSLVNETADVTCFVLWTDNVGLNYGIIQHNETRTATNTSQISLSGTSAWTNLTISSETIDPGNIECKAYAFDQGNLVNTTTIIIPVADAIAPRVENISYIPNTTDDIDPNVMINVTADVADNVSVSLVLLQYKQTNASDWTNVTMFLNSGNQYKGNFTPATGNWSFRIHANDTANNINASSITNISVSTDETWINASTLPSTKSIVKDQSRIINLGNITLNNTGDFDLNFTVNSSQTWITFNGSSNPLIARVNQNLNTSIFNVTANTTGFAVGQFTYNITIYAFTINPHLVSTQTIPGNVVIQNVPGPLLTVTIDNYDSHVEQGQNGVSFSASVSNSGTDDATNTWLAWTLPTGWSVASGSSNKTLGFLGIGQSGSNSITVDISSTAETGTKTITTSSNSSKGGYGSASKSVSVTSPTSPSPSPSAGTTSGGGAISVLPTSAAQSLLLQSAESFKIIRGEGNTFPIRITNAFLGTTLDNITLNVSGFLTRYIQITPDILHKIGYNETKQFNVTIIAPTYSVIGEFSLNFTISGVKVSSSGAVPFTGKRIVTLVIHEVSKEEAEEQINETEKIIKEIKSAGFGINKVNRLLDRAKKFLDNERYEDVQSIAQQILETKETTLEISKLVEDIKGNIRTAEENFLSVPGTRNLLNLALATIFREDYETAKQRLMEAQLTFVAETRGKISILKIIIDYWHYMLGGIAVSSFASVVIYRRNLATRLTNKLKDLDVEEATLLAMKKDVQVKAFIDKSIGMETYGEVTRKCDARIAELEQLRTNFRTKRRGIIKTSGELNILGNEYKELIRLMEEVQDGYLNQGTISQETYDRRMEQYRTRKADLQKEVAFLEAKLTKQKKSKIRLTIENWFNRLVRLVLRRHIEEVEKEEQPQTGEVTQPKAEATTKEKPQKLPMKLFERLGSTAKIKEKVESFKNTIERMKLRLKRKEKSAEKKIAKEKSRIKSLLENLLKIRKIKIIPKIPQIKIRKPKLKVSHFKPSVDAEVLKEEKKVKRFFRRMLRKFWFKPKMELKEKLERVKSQLQKGIETSEEIVEKTLKREKAKTGTLKSRLKRKIRKLERSVESIEIPTVKMSVDLEPLKKSEEKGIKTIRKWFGKLAKVRKSQAVQMKLHKRKLKVGEEI